jgi:hypothetical protein
MSKFFKMPKFYDLYYRGAYREAYAVLRKIVDKIIVFNVRFVIIKRLKIILPE